MVTTPLSPPTCFAQSSCGNCKFVAHNYKYLKELKKKIQPTSLKNESYRYGHQWKTTNCMYAAMGNRHGLVPCTMFKFKV
ncbi:hypothetical protein VNO77_35650 [Canavalia gladiata]|uniref:Uncharacterized protein n=1 Tax=Canavalia gladiata TaxID=3824 RepID=A0AAN9PV98_CANGL